MQLLLCLFLAANTVETVFCLQKNVVKHSLKTILFSLILFLKMHESYLELAICEALLLFIMIVFVVFFQVLKLLGR